MILNPEKSFHTICEFNLKLKLNILPDDRIHRFSKQRPKLCKVETMKSSRVNNQQVEGGRERTWRQVQGIWTRIQKCQIWIKMTEWPELQRGQQPGQRRRECVDKPLDRGAEGRVHSVRVHSPPKRQLELQSLPRRTSNSSKTNM